MKIEKKYHFYAAHRNKKADEKCGRIHGHTYKVKCIFEFTEMKDGVETYMVDANYSDSGKTEFIGKVVYDEYDGLENAVENGDVEIDSLVSETDVINDKGEVVSAVDNAVAVGLSLKEEEEKEMDPLGDLKEIVDSSKPIKDEGIPF